MDLEQSYIWNSMQSQDDLASLVNSSLHKQESWALWHEWHHNKHDDWEEESKTQRTSPLCGIVSCIEEGHAHVRSEAIAKRNHNAIETNEETTDLWRCHFCRVRWSYGEEAPRSHASEEASCNEHAPVLRSNEQDAAEDGPERAEDHTSLSAPAIHDTTDDDDAEESASLEYTVESANDGVRVWLHCAGDWIKKVPSKSLGLSSPFTPIPK